jgi:hypothetical protein
MTTLALFSVHCTSSTTKHNFALRQRSKSEIYDLDLVYKTHGVV